MNPTFDAFLRSWPFDPWLMAAFAVAAAIYWRGWLSLRANDPRRWGVWRLAAFLGGLLAIFLALASPIDAFASLLLQAHMTQHLLLMMVAPPLVWLGAPFFPLLRGLPKAVRDAWAAPCLRSRKLRKAFTWLTQPWVAWLVYVSVTWLWHVPRGYELALSRGDWHVAEHLSFVASALLFWYPVVRPYPSRPRWSRWLLLPYLILADVQNTILAAWLTFSSDVLYPHYARVPRLAGISALDDQSVAGVIMWVPGSIAFLLPLFWIALGLLFGPRQAPTRRRIEKARLPRKFASLPVIDLKRPAVGRPVFDLLRVPLIGALLRWRLFRPLIQCAMALLAAAVILDGLRGPSVSPMNLAGVLPWVHWRGAVVFGLLVAGNLFCMACPFTLPRALARRWLPRGRTWPRALRGKWFAIALLVVFLWSYEAFSLWDNPWLTAWIAIGYFAAAFVVDSFFRGATFCKYVCPIGQFNFVQSLVSPLEVAVRDPQVCTTCRTKDCIRGRDAIPGCELDLFQPRKSGNMDCTFCLNCVQACPVANVGLVASLPGSQLWHDRLRSGIGRLSRRPDIAALAAVLVFGSFANAAGMVQPVVAWEQQLQTMLGLSSPRWIVTIYYALALVLAPLAAVGLASALSRRWAGLSSTRVRIATRYVYALLPLGFGMWLAHYGFHLLTGYETAVPVTQRFAAELGWAGLGSPQWSCACCKPVFEGVLHAELIFLDFGFLLSLYTAYRLGSTDDSRTSRALKALLPWSVLITTLFLLGVWLVFQPMQMRGTMTIGQ